MDLASRYLGPPLRGLEIGASAVNPFDGLRSWNLDVPDGAPFLAAQERIAGRAVAIDVHGLGDPLPVRPGALDFLLTSHVLEHMPDTIRCLDEWGRAVRIDGTIFLIVPHRERTFDRDRPRTPLEHHLADYATGMTIERSPMAPTSHYHVWITEDVVRLVHLLNDVGLIDWELMDVEDIDSKVGNGFTLVARKRSQPPPLRAAATGPVTFHLATRQLPFVVPGRTMEYVVPANALGDVPSTSPRRRLASCPCLEHNAGLPRGLYRAVPIHAGFPPLAGQAFELEVGSAAGTPRLDDASLEGSRLRFVGQDLQPTTYLEVAHPDGSPRHLLPDWDDGALIVDTTGLAVPDVPLEITAVNPPPGGGRSPPYSLRAHLDA